MTTFDLQQRTNELHQQYLHEGYARTSHGLVILMAVQWAFAVVLALVLSPFAWEGSQRSVHVHVIAAVVLGGLLFSLPAYLARQQPAAVHTRWVIAVAQMLWSALLIHLSGGRIETHFHVFGSLAFLAYYRDWKVLIPATLTVVIDHLARGMLWPQSVYGVENPEWWRFLEHAGWVVFEDVVLVFGCLRGAAELYTLAKKQVAAEQALVSMQESSEALNRAEKLAAVGQLAASVGHELRNPLAAVRNAVTYIHKRVLAPDASPTVLRDDPRVGRFFGIVEQELTNCSRIISDLLDFARERPAVRVVCPLQPLVDEAIAIIPRREGVTIVNEVPTALPAPELDRDQFRQVLANLAQNASEAIAAGKTGTVRIAASGGGNRPWSITVADDGAGMRPEVAKNIFEPLFTTKARGTGLGLAIVASLVKRHGGAIAVHSVPDVGTTFTVELPPQVRSAS